MRLQSWLHELVAEQNGQTFDFDPNYNTINSTQNVDIAGLWKLCNYIKNIVTKATAQ